MPKARTVANKKQNDENNLMVDDEIRLLYADENLESILPTKKTTIHGFGIQLYKLFPKLNGFWNSNKSSDNIICVNM
jgi:hypothetical protein